MLKTLIIFALLNITAIIAKDLPPGYYAFEKATKVHGVPPKVRKPPYIPANVPCPGAIKSDYRLSPKETLCGDLNRGYVPLNPMMQEIEGQPYPFELIRNKTLYFLAKSLPFLKEDINNIPKVAKLSSSLPVTENFNSNVNYNYQGNHLRSKRTIGSTVSTKANQTKGHKEYKLYSGFNLTETRQKVCEQNDGMLCQVMHSLTGGQGSNAMLNTLSQAVQVLSAATNAATTAQNIGSLASMLQQLGSGSASSSSGNSEQSKQSMFHQVINILSSLSGSSNQNNNNNYSPLVAVLDYFMTSASSPISSLLPARRKKPLDFEDIANEALSVSQVPPTPCPSIEEYVAPVYARNYQGVWKYVVQIPNEGYFTQTVQKTACVKGRCDFMDGFCHESPRWVSLLVAEIFYPNPKFPNLVSPPPPPSVSQENDQPKQASSNIKVKYQPAPYHHYNAMNLANQYPFIGDIRDFDQYINNPKISYRSERPNEENTLAKPRSLRPTKVKRESRKEDNKEECDGYDNIGCYVVRVYYDWFLVPGSCKCWKKSQGSGLDTLKKIFIGK